MDDGIVVSVPFVYLARCSDHSLYVGRTEDLAHREDTHNDGFGSAYTAARRPVRIVYAEEHSSNISAARRERQVKRWSAEKKEALVSGTLSGFTRRRRIRPTIAWQELSNRRRR